ncbi:hypothetical protein [Nibribacter koreensis]|uniref:YD repeat-containing protein n=1 Tax=Nibribacter koreensis TaxID=1084519 RepID=A0ABP8FSV5_9BACT
MKLTVRLFTTVFFLAFSLASCDLEEPTPVDPAQGPVYLTQISTLQGDERQFVYNGQGWLTKITGKGAYALNGNTTSSSDVLFDTWRRLAYIVTQGSGTNTENVYHYTSENLLYKVEELINGQVERYHTFEYDGNRQLKTRYGFYKEGPDAETPRATRKQTYTYAATGNVTEIVYYQKVNPASEWTLAQTQKYTDYDGKTGVQHMTGLLFTPTIVLHRNNPGKVTTTLATGEQHVTVFAYQYNERNLPVKRTATSDQGEVLETTFTYQF